MLEKLMQESDGDDFDEVDFCSNANILDKRQQSNNSFISNVIKPRQRQDMNELLEELLSDKK